jgi:hypothetical protein
MKLNNMLTLYYALFALHASHSVGTYQAVNPNNAVILEDLNPQQHYCQSLTACIDSLTYKINKL